MGLETVDARGVDTVGREEVKKEAIRGCFNFLGIAEDDESLRFNFLGLAEDDEFLRFKLGLHKVFGEAVNR